jgi:Protein of unknown function (DUF1295)
VSDAQKFYILRERKGLIEDGLFTRTRNPNYLGEILIYVSFAIMSMHWPRVKIKRERGPEGAEGGKPKSTENAVTPNNWFGLEKAG